MGFNEATNCEDRIRTISSLSLWFNGNRIGSGWLFSLQSIPSAYTSSSLHNSSYSGFLFRREMSDMTKPLAEFSVISSSVTHPEVIYITDTLFVKVTNSFTCASFECADGGWMVDVNLRIRVHIIAHMRKWTLCHHRITAAEEVEPHSLLS